MRRIPIVPTLIVLLAVAAMIGLGVWQLQRLQWKEALLARYQQAQAMSAEVPWPTAGRDADAALYRHSSVTCVQVSGVDAEAGHNDKQATGWAHTAHCTLADGSKADVVIGWSEAPAGVIWGGGTVPGIVAPARDNRPLIEKLFDDLVGSAAPHAIAPRLIATHPLAGLAANATPDPSEIANNHFSYAMQWFLFAGTALIIYALALRKRWLGR